jgi:hypothetical protein
MENKEKTVVIETEVLNSIKKLLMYSFEPIEFDYHSLTKTEKKLVTEEQFEKIVKLLK